MRVVFAGTPVFAALALRAILDAGHDVPLVLTQPDRPSGRGMKLTPSPVKQAALDAGIEVSQPRSLRLDGKYPDDAQAARQVLIDAQADVMVVAAYGLILPLWTLVTPARGCLNIHASLLPRWRGAAPIQRAIEAGDVLTGVTVMQMDEGLDTGDMLLRIEVPILPTHNAVQLHDALAQAGGQSIVQALAALEQDALQPQKQPEEGVTYAAKLDRAESPLDFSQPAQVLERRVRAFDPVPGATAQLPGLAEPVKVWRAQALTDSASRALAAGKAPGEVVRSSPEGIELATADGLLKLLELQRPGARRQNVNVFVRSWPA